MGMTIEDVLAEYNAWKITISENVSPDCVDALDTAIDTTRKYQQLRDKISTIYVGYRHGYEVMADVMEILREVEDGVND